MSIMKSPEQKTFSHDTACDTTQISTRIGVLITNLGTPDSCAVADVRRYLREFLWDRRVVESPRLWWWLVLHLVILTLRPRKSAAAYQKIWSESGSPLLVIARQQRDKLQQLLGADCVVELGMRYGNPAVGHALESLHDAGARRVLVLPLYPQYCAATTASTFDAVSAALARRRWIPQVRMVNHYHDHAGYILALANRVRQYQQAHGMSEVLLMSFHGIPQTYFDAGDPYPCECRKTARLLAEELGLDARAWRLSFQSRFGPKKWVQPYTNETLTALARDGVRDVQVVCPGFSADCLETLEEIAMENRDIFRAAGGEKYGYIPCLNDDDEHVQALADIITSNIGDWIMDSKKNTAT